MKLVCIYIFNFDKMSLQIVFLLLLQHSFVNFVDHIFGYTAPVSQKIRLTKNTQNKTNNDSEKTKRIIITNNAIMTKREKIKNENNIKKKKKENKQKQNT